MSGFGVLGEMEILLDLLCEIPWGFVNDDMDMATARGICTEYCVYDGQLKCS